MKTEIVIFWGFIAALVAGSAWLVHDTKQMQEAKRTERNAFYLKHNCRPLGYVASKYDPIRTYQCDNGVYVWEDMQ